MITPWPGTVKYSVMQWDWNDCAVERPDRELIPVGLGCVRGEE